MLSLRLLPLLAIALVPLACRSLPTPKGSGVQVLYEGSLELAAPVDVVVAPVENRSEDPGVPVDLLRESFQRALVKRRYSPLSIEYVEQAQLLTPAGGSDLASGEGPTAGEGRAEAGVMHAVYRPGSLGEDAVLQVIVHAWDDSLFDTHSTITAEVDAYMLDGSGGPELWAGRFSDRLHLNAYRTRAATDRMLLRFGCDELAEEILAKMPARTAKPGRP